MCIAQNGPGITNFVTSTAAAFWAHSPVVVITPETGSGTLGLGGFQETEQLPIFSKITKFQAHVNNRARMAELTGRAFDRAHLELGPDAAQHSARLLLRRHRVRDPAADRDRARRRRREEPRRGGRIARGAKFPVILCGGGVVMADGQPEAIRLAELLQAPVANSYLHNDSFPAKHPLWVGPLGYQGSKAAMKLIAKADVVLALGTRLGPFGTLPQYGMEYWPKDAKIIQVDADAKMLGLVKPISVGICGDAKAAALALVERLSGKSLACIANKDARLADIAATKKAWEAELDGWAHEKDAWSLEVSKNSTYMHPRQMLRELERAMPAGAMVSTDIGNICSVSNSYLRFDRPRSMFAAMSFGNCGYAFPTIVGAKVAAPDRPAIAYVGDGAWGMSFGEIQTCVRENIPVTAVVFNNGQWGAEKKNHVDFYENRFVGVNLDKQPSWAEVAQAMGADGHTIDKLARRRPRAARGREGAARGQDDDPRDDGDARAGRPVPPRRAGAADAASREIQVDRGQARLTAADRRATP